MVIDLFIKCTETIVKCRKAGYSFINDFVDLLYQHRSEVNISHIITYWEIKVSSSSIQRFTYFSGGQQLLTEGIDLSGISRSSFLVDTNEESGRTFKAKGFWKDRHILGFPIFNDSDFELRCAVVLLSNAGIIEIENYQKQIFFSLLQSTQPNTLNYKPTFEAEKSLIRPFKVVMDEDSNEIYEPIEETLDNLSKGEDGDINYHGLSHFSLWEYSTKANKTVISKILCRNCVSLIPHKNSHLCLSNTDRHYLISLLNNCSSSRMPCLIILEWKEVKESFMDCDFFNNLNLNENNSSVIVVIDKFNDYGGFGYISCLYVKDLPYSAFVSTDVVLQFSDLIFKAIRGNCALHRARLLQKLMFLASSNPNAGTNFYIEATKLIRDTNEAENCSLYFLTTDDSFQCTCWLDEAKILKIGKFELCEQYSHDIEFRQFIEHLNLSSNDEQKLGVTQLSYNNVNGKVVKSALFISTYLHSSYPKCVILLINKRHNSTKISTSFNNTFSIDNFQQTMNCGAFLYQYKLLWDSIENKNYLLKKFRHEMPSCTDAILNSVSQIKELINLDVVINKNNLLNIAKMVELHNSRVALLANFFSTIDFDISRFTEDKESISFNKFMNSYIDIFRTEGKFRGVDVYFDTRNDKNEKIDDVNFYVSNYFLLSIVNVIINAVRYSSAGTCVNIIGYKNKIEVIDIGIPIPSHERKKIFEEGYRGDDARRINEKGMGYGLFLSKKIIEAHNGDIIAQSEFLYPQNYYAQNAVLNYYKSLPSDEQRNDFVYQGIEPVERSAADKIIKELKESDEMKLEREFLNLKRDVISAWISYINKNNAVFYDMKEIYFSEKVYKVTFTITIP